MHIICAASFAVSAVSVAIAHRVAGVDIGAEIDEALDHVLLLVLYGPMQHGQVVFLGAQHTAV